MKDLRDRVGEMKITGIVPSEDYLIVDWSCQLGTGQVTMHAYAGDISLVKWLVYSRKDLVDVNERAFVALVMEAVAKLGVMQ